PGGGPVPGRAGGRAHRQALPEPRRAAAGQTGGGGVVSAAELHPAVASHKAIRAVAKRRSDLARRKAAHAQAVAALQDRHRRAEAEYQARFEAALANGDETPERPRPLDADAIRQAQVAQ